jgi:hypothetical protein
MVQDRQRSHFPAGFHLQLADRLDRTPLPWWWWYSVTKVTIASHSYLYTH